MMSSLIYSAFALSSSPEKRSANLLLKMDDSSVDCGDLT